MAIGQTVGSLDALKKSLERGSGGGNTWLRRVPKDKTLTVRFLTEPEGNWVHFRETFSDGRSRPVADGEQLESGERASERWLANALDVDTDRVIPLVMPKTLARKLLLRYEKYGTIMDRDYELSRMGTGLDTEYDVEPDSKMARNLAKHELLDLLAVLEDAINDPGPEANKAKNPQKKLAPVAEPAKPKSRNTKEPRPDLEADRDRENEDDDLPLDLDIDLPHDDEDDEPLPEANVELDDDEAFPEDDDEDEKPTYTVAQLKAKPVAELRILAKNAGHNTSGLNKEGLIGVLAPEDF